MSNTQTINLRKVTTGVICHQVNCQGKMGAGIAKTIAEIFPYAKDEYLKLCNSIHVKLRLGLTQFVMMEKRLFVGHLFGQYYYGRDKRYTDYDAIENCLLQVKTFVEKKENSKTCVNCDYTRYENIKICPRCGDERAISIESFPCYIPHKMGCMLAGGDWNIVSQLIEKYVPNAIIFKHKENI